MSPLEKSLWYKAEFCLLEIAVQQPLQSLAVTSTFPQFSHYSAEDTFLKNKVGLSLLGFR